MERLTIPFNGGYLFKLPQKDDEKAQKEFLEELSNMVGTYEDLKEQGLLPKFHLGDEFWVVHYDGAAKENIVMLQQKKNGTAIIYTENA